MLDTELASEQAHLDRAYARLETLQEMALALAKSELQAHVRTPAAKVERDVREAHGVRRYASLRIDGGLCFGRIDSTEGETFHIGRVGVSEDDMTPLVIDWRAPVAEPFYRATPLDPLGLVRRRHLLTRGRRVVGIEDEPLDLDASAGDRDLVLVGEAALLGALTERRTGRMRDIVATIQAEQDTIIRAPLAGALVVQGGPGTGKTAVALHRAAYLLYRHRFPLEEQGVLVIGPNPLFLRYIERVLPSLGESRCRLSTIDRIHRVKPAGPEPSRAVARIKGDARMAAFIARAVESRQRPLVRRETIGVGSFRLRIGHGATARIVDSVKAREGTHNERRPLIERLVLRHLLRQYHTAVERAHTAGLPAQQLPDKEVTERLRAAPDVRRILDRMWPVLTAEELLGQLYAHEPLLRDAAIGILKVDEVDLLRRTEGGWTAADLPLLDEADVLLGKPPRQSRPRQAAHVEDASAMVDRVLAGRIPYCQECDAELSWVVEGQLWRCDRFGCGAEYEPEAVMSPADAVEVRDLQRLLHTRVGGDAVAEDEGWFDTFGHVVVDEAQELSAMQWRMVARRCPSRSMTIVGDLAQGSGAAATDSWASVFDALGLDGHGHTRARAAVVALTVNYRTPAEVMKLADRVASGATPATCVRESGQEPRFVACRPDEIVAACIAAVEQETASVPDGKLAVIAPDELVNDIADALHIDRASALDAAVTVVGGDDVKGLEFDSVIVVEPASFDDRSLYVALTRTTTRLALVHASPLPDALMTSGSTR